MENGYTGVSNNDVATLALAGRSGYGYGYGHGHGNFGGDGSAVKEAIRGSRDINLLESVNNGARDQALSSQIRQHNDNISDRLSSSQDFMTNKIDNQSLEFRFANITQEHAAIERQTIANHQTLLATMSSNKADTDRQLHSMEMKQVECCCELKAGQATIIANQESARLAASEAENQNLRTQIMINNQSALGNG